MASPLIVVVTGMVFFKFYHELQVIAVFYLGIVGIAMVVRYINWLGTLPRVKRHTL